MRCKLKEISHRPKLEYLSYPKKCERTGQKNFDSPPPPASMSSCCSPTAAAPPPRHRLRHLPTLQPMNPPRSPPDLAPLDRRRRHEANGMKPCSLLPALTSLEVTRPWSLLLAAGSPGRDSADLRASSPAARPASMSVGSRPEESAGRTAFVAGAAAGDTDAGVTASCERRWRHIRLLVPHRHLKTGRGRNKRARVVPCNGGKASRTDASGLEIDRPASVDAKQPIRGSLSPKASATRKGLPQLTLLLRARHDYVKALIALWRCTEKHVSPCHSNTPTASGPETVKHSFHIVARRVGGSF